MIFGGEMSKIGHGVGRQTVAIFGGCAMWLFFAVAREQYIYFYVGTQLLRTTDNGRWRHGQRMTTRNINLLPR